MGISYPFGERESKRERGWGQDREKRDLVFLVRIKKALKRLCCCDIAGKRAFLHIHYAGLLIALTRQRRNVKFDTKIQKVFCLVRKILFTDEKIYVLQYFSKPWKSHFWVSSSSRTSAYTGTGKRKKEKEKKKTKKSSRGNGPFIMHSRAHTVNDQVHQARKKMKGFPNVLLFWCISGLVTSGFKRQ